jgi:hypothetical protein
VLFCIECGCCSGELGKGWAAFRCKDPDTAKSDTSSAIAIYCPVCAAAEFGFRPEAAANYVRGWEPRSSAGDNAAH